MSPCIDCSPLHVVHHEIIGLNAHDMRLTNLTVTATSTTTTISSPSTASSAPYHHSICTDGTPTSITTATGALIFKTIIAASLATIKYTFQNLSTTTCSWWSIAHL